MHTAKDIVEQPKHTERKLGKTKSEENANAGAIPKSKISYLDSTQIYRIEAVLAGRILWKVYTDDLKMPEKPFYR